MAKAFFGFATAEWTLALQGDPEQAARFMTFLESLPEDASGLGQVGIEALVALSRVSHEFARRVVTNLDAATPEWRLQWERTGASGSEGTEPADRKLWDEFRALVDAATRDE
jgi:hypothetical protein